MLWVILTIAAMQSFATAYTAVSWYFYHKDSDGEEVQAKYMAGIQIGMRYHLGTVAYGAALITITTIIKGLFEYLAKKAETLEQGD